MLCDGDDLKVGQVYNWYLDYASAGTHSAEGVAKKHLNLTIQRSLIDSYIPGDFRRHSFAGLETRDLQILIDAAAASGPTRNLVKIRNHRFGTGLRLGTMHHRE